MCDDLMEIDNVKGYGGRDVLWTKIATLLRHWRLSETQDEGGECGYPLIDALSVPGSTVATGEHEIVVLADEIHLLVQENNKAAGRDGAG